MLNKPKMTDRVMQVDIRIDTDGWREVSASLHTLVTKAVDSVMCADKKSFAAELSILLTDDAAITELNRKWRGRDGAPGVLAFPARTIGDPEPALLGDVVVALEPLKAESRLAGVSETDHLSHLIVHGVLHLLGYDHETDVKANAMEKREVGILADLGIPNPYVDDKRPMRIVR